MKELRFLLLVMAICLASGVKAQFYDSADDIYFYVECNDNGQVKDNGQVFIFNFDGRKACYWNEHVGWVKSSLKSNPSYYEDQVERTEYTLRYISSNTYQAKGYFQGEYYNYKFSYDRNTMTLIEHKNMPIMNRFGFPSGQSEWRDYNTVFKRVDKSFFRVGRSRTPSGTMHE